MIDDILEFNRRFVREKGYEPYITTKYPDRKRRATSRTSPPSTRTGSWRS